MSTKDRKFEHDFGEEKFDMPEIIKNLKVLQKQYSNPPPEGIYQGSYSKTLAKFKTNDGLKIKCDFGVIKSAIQKYIRRGDTQNSYYYIVLGYLFSLSDNKRASGLITNLINRLRVISLEDVGISNYNIIPIVNELLFKFYSIESGINHWVSKCKKLLLIAKNLSKSKKIRIYSWLKALYNVPVSKNKNKKSNQYKFVSFLLS